MADSFAEQLRAQLDGIQAEIDRLDAKRRLIEQLLTLESASVAPAPAAAAPGRRSNSRRAPAAKRPRMPRGLASGKIRDFLGQQREPAHATAILTYLEQHEAAPRTAKPMASVQSTLQRLKEQGEIENAGRNRWRLRAAETAPAASASPASQAAGSDPAAPRPAAGPPVVTSTTTFGTRPGAGG